MACFAHMFSQGWKILFEKMQNILSKKMKTNVVASFERK